MPEKTAFFMSMLIDKLEAILERYLKEVHVYPKLLFLLLSYQKLAF